MLAKVIDMMGHRNDTWREDRGTSENMCGHQVGE